MKHILTAEQLTTEELAKLFDLADAMRKQTLDADSSRKLATKHLGKQICGLFYEASTRTRISFEAAALKLGMGVVSTENAGEFSSAVKGETITDTIQVLDQYQFAAIVMRHPVVGSVAEAAKVSHTPIINAGDGAGDHPTQSFLDLYTIHRHFGRLENLKVVMGGDLRNGRVMRSLAKLLSRYPNNHITFVSLPELRMKDDVKDVMRANGATFDETDQVEPALAGADVAYWIRLQKERLANAEAIADGGFVLNPEVLQHLPDAAIIMSPLPRVGEITPEVDTDPRAKYFEQAGNGLYIRMALLDQIITEG